MISGTKRILQNPFYFLRKHYCPNCKTQLKVVKVSKIVSSYSYEAKNYDFSLGDTFLQDDVKFVFKEFECPECKMHLTADEIKSLSIKYEEFNRHFIMAVFCLLY